MLKTVMPWSTRKKEEEEAEPPNFLNPSRRPSESRPFFVDPPAFFVACRTAPHWNGDPHRNGPKAGKEEEEGNAEKGKIEAVRQADAAVLNNGWNCVLRLSSSMFGDIILSPPQWLSLLLQDDSKGNRVDL